MQNAGDLLSPLLAVGDFAFGVSRDDSGDRLIQIPFGDELETANDVDLAGGYVDGPIKVDDEHLLVLLDSGETVCFNSNMEQVWSATLPPEGNDRLAGNPTVVDGQLMMAFVSGLVVSVNPQNGDVNGSVDLGQPIAHPPVSIDGRYFVTGSDGTLHELQGLAIFQ